MKVLQGGYGYLPALRGGKRFLVAQRGITTTAPTIQEYPRHDLPPTTTLLRSSRREAVKNAKPFSSFLTDTYQRQHDYLRISITEKCNLRCLYCMPEEGVPQSPPPDLLTTPEIFMLSSIFVSQGVTKIRLTGGEPTVRRDILPLMHQIGSLRSQGLKELCLTTNGISLHRKLDSMVEAGLTGVNLSLDTLDPFQFQIMTRRKGFEAVMTSINRILEMNRLGANIKLKINCVVMRGMNEREILPFVELGREQDLQVRFIEYMPFDGNKWSQGKMLPFQEMLDIIRQKYPGLKKVVDHKNDTSKTYEIPGFVGKMGFITSMTHNFCGTCNRLRITSDGNLKVCLFGNAEVSLRDILRKSNQGSPIDVEAFEAMKTIEIDRRQGLSSGALGMADNERELLDVIGLAVSRKKKEHAGMGDLENMKNRPMILIDQPSMLSRTLNSPRPIVSFQTRPTSIIIIPTGSITQSTTPPSLYNPRSYSTTPPLPPKTPKLTHLTPTGTAHMVPISHKPATSRTAVAVCALFFSNTAAVGLIRSNAMRKGDVLSVARVAGIMAAKRTSELVPLCHPVMITDVALEVVVCEANPSCAPQQILQEEQEEEPASKAETSSTTSSIPWQGTGQGDAYPFHCPSPSSSSSSSSSTGSRSPLATTDDSALKPAPRSTGFFEKTYYGSIDITATVSCDGKTGVEMEALTAASVAALTVYDMCKAVDKGMRIEGLRVVRKEGGKSGDWTAE